MTIRWVLTDPATAETWQMPINPNEMTSPFGSKNLKHSYGARGFWGGTERVALFQLPPGVVEWEWKGVIRTKEHYDSYVYWASKKGVVHVTDHLGRTWVVFLRSFEPEDRRPMATVPWRLKFTVKAMLVGQMPSAAGSVTIGSSGTLTATGVAA